MEFVHVSHPHVILFMLIIGYIYFGMYFLRDVSPIHTFPPKFLAPEKPPLKNDDIISFSDLVLIFEAYASVIYNITLHFDKY